MRRSCVTIKMNCVVIIFAAALSIIAGSEVLALSVPNSDNNEINNNSTVCDTDRDCPETMFCYNELCYSCFNCSKIFRQNWLRCAKEPSDCGKCLPGYHEDSYRTSYYHWCRQDVSIAEHQKTEDPEVSIFKFNIQWLVIFMFLCLSTLGFLSYRCYNSRERSIPTHTNSWTTNVDARYEFTNPPPPYKEDDLPVNDCSRSFHLEVTGNSEDDQQKAVPFLYVENLRTENESNTIQFVGTTQSINSVSTEAFGTINLDIHDENTVPSSWTPGASYGEAVKNEDGSPPKKRKRRNENGKAEESAEKEKESQ